MATAPTLEAKQLVRQNAISTLHKALKAGKANYEFSPRDALVAAVGEDEAAELEYKAYDKLSDVVRTATELKQLMDYAQKDFDQAREFLSGGSGIVNRLGILQSRGPQIDANAAVFHLQVELAVDALYDLEMAIVKAAPGADKVRAVRLAREAREKAQNERIATEQATRKAKKEISCQVKAYSGSRDWHGHVCGKKGRYLVKFDDGTQQRFCGTHVKVGYGTDKAPYKIGDTMESEHGGSGPWNERPQPQVTEVIDLNAAPGTMF